MNGSDMACETSRTGTPWALKLCGFCRELLGMWSQLAEGFGLLF